MARSDLLLDLVEAGQRHDFARFQAVVEALIAEERANQHHLLADRLTALITTTGRQQGRDELARSMSDLLDDRLPVRSLHDVHLAPAPLQEVVDFLEENRRGDLLRSYGLEPRSRILLQGPPGNGKTSLSEAIANELMLPFYVLRFEGVVSSYLGETAARLDRVFEFVRTRRCVLLIDEFDAIAKERSDIHETGEIKRVVSTLLMQVDRLPAHVLLIAATNHASLLDSAANRRFQVRLTLDRPSRRQREHFFARHSMLTGSDGYSARTLADKLSGASFADLEEFVLSVRRRQILDEPVADLKGIIRRQLSRAATSSSGIDDD